MTLDDRKKDLHDSLDNVLDWYKEQLDKKSEDCNCTLDTDGDVPNWNFEGDVSDHDPGDDSESFDVVLEPQEGDNRDYLVEAFGNENNKRILVTEGVYHIDVTADKSGHHGNRNQNKNNIWIDHDSVTVVFEDGAIFKVNPNHFGTHEKQYSVLTIQNAENVEIINPTIRGDKHEHLDDAKGEWAAGIKIYKQTKNVLIKGADIREMWGDGIDIGGQIGSIDKGSDNPTTMPYHITIDDFKTIDDGRNGISVTNGKDIKILNGITAKNDRAAPASGIDFEKAYKWKTLTDILVENVETANNRVDGIISFNGTGKATFRNIYSHGNTAGIKIRRNVGKQVVENSRFEDNTRIMLYKISDDVVLRNNTIKNGGHFGILVKKWRDGNIEIKDNFIEGSRNWDISVGSLDKGYDGGNLSIKGNEIVGWQIQYGIDARVGKHVEIIGNTLKRNQRGIKVRSGIKDVIIKDNILKDTERHDIYIDMSKGSKLTLKNNSLSKDVDIPDEFKGGYDGKLEQDTNIKI